MKKYLAIIALLASTSAFAVTLVTFDIDQIPTADQKPLPEPR